LGENKWTQKLPKIPGNTFSNALLKSRLQNFASDAARKKPRFARFFLAGVTKKTMRTFNRFLPGTLIGGWGDPWVANIDYQHCTEILYTTSFSIQFCWSYVILINERPLLKVIKGF